MHSEHRFNSICAGMVIVGLISAAAIPETLAPSKPLITRIDSSSFAITGPHDEVICAKTLETCQTALRAIQSGRWTPFDSYNSSLLRCTPKADCFPPETNCIKGYNCK